MAPLRNTQNYYLAKIIDVRITKGEDDDDNLVSAGILP